MGFCLWLFWGSRFPTSLLFLLSEHKPRRPFSSELSDVFLASCVYWTYLVYNLRMVERGQLISTSHPLPNIPLSVAKIPVGSSADALGMATFLLVTFLLHRTGGVMR